MPLNILLHTDQSSVADLGVAAEIGPSEWNKHHTFGGGANGALLVRDSTQSDGANWSTAYAGPYAIGVATNTRSGLRLSTNGIVSGAVGGAVTFGGTVTASANGDTLVGLGDWLDGVTYAKGVFTGLLAAQLQLNGASMAATGAGTIDTAAALRIVGPPTIGTTNYALWVDAGTSRLDGALIFTTTAASAGSAIFGEATTLAFSSGTAAFVWYNNALSAERMRLTDGGILALGTTVTAGLVAGEMGLPNARYYQGLNAAGTAHVALIGLDTSNRVTLAVSGDDIRWGRALVALGGGAGATLGTIGGLGPTGAAQFSWLRVIDSTGTPGWMPIWR